MVLSPRLRSPILQKLILRRLFAVEQTPKGPDVRACVPRTRGKVRTRLLSSRSRHVFVLSSPSLGVGGVSCAGWQLVGWCAF